MDYNSLKYVITVHKHQSISKAAEELFLSQPNISKSIQKLEKEIGIIIFQRTSKGVNTTVEGKEFIKRAQELIKMFDDFSEEFSKSKTSLFSLNITHPQDNFYYSKVAEFMTEFQNEKDININIFDGTMEEIIDKVIKETTNLGIICVNQFELAYYKRLLQLNNLEFIIKEPLKLKVIASAKNPLIKQNFADINILKNQTIIVNNSNNFHDYYSEKYQLFFGNNIVKIPGGINQLLTLNKLPNSYIISLPLPDEILKKYNCKMIDFVSNNNEWQIIFTYKKTTILTEKEKKLISYF